MTFGTLNSWPPGGPGSLIDGMKRYLRSSLTIGNLETALGDLPMSKCGAQQTDCYEFEAPDSTAADLKADGFSAVNVANNHTLDAGGAGETSTDEALDAAGLDYAGRPGQIAYLRRDGVKIALGLRPMVVQRQRARRSRRPALVRQARQHASVVIVMERLGAEGDDPRHVTHSGDYLGQDRATQSPSPTRSSTQAPIWWSAQGRTCARTPVVPRPPDLLQRRQVLRFPHARP